ncbi:hypothetical protein F4827_006603 [Paraburkholderia bannensis]|uniref:Uncharacterized protein n=1 Tax=Paraburkholderia bannensis TaxID=765414 RepID=A0A7W9U482_9BURK|nr:MULTISPECIES: hypothetical protein [Paraburkholderia]MBB3261773.1 hypothetical protein [Paraburkholderia sp. WP4_3_2]MBB6106727.1 hypothetical protein [Paraburkholderia bannensis]
MPVTIAVSVAMVWLICWPQLDGHYTGAGHTVVDVVPDGHETQVTFAADGLAQSPVPTGLGHAGRQEGVARGFAAVKFGQAIDGYTLEFRPLHGAGYELAGGCRRIALSKRSPLSLFVGAHPYLTILLATAGVLAIVGYLLNAKAEHEPQIIAPMWLAYFGAMSASVGVLLWAGQAGIFGFDGEPQTALARWILTAADALIDVNAEATYLLGLMAIVVVPQALAYLAAGVLSGAAQRPRYVVFTWRYISLFIAKGFFSASAVSLAVVMAGSWNGWLGPDILHVFGYALGSMCLLLVGVLVFATVPVTQPEPRPVSRVVRKVHKWMRRKLRKGKGDVARQLEREARSVAPEQHGILAATRRALRRGR